MKILRLLLFFFTLLLLRSQQLHAGYFPTPLAMPDDSEHFFQLGPDTLWGGGVFYEEGSGSGGFNGSDQRRSLGALYSDKESFLTMLRSPQGEIRTKLAGTIDPRLLTAPDLGGRRGAIDISGHIFHRQITLGGTTNLRFIKILPGMADLALYIPFVNKRFDAVNLKLRPFEAVDVVDLALEGLTQDIPGFLQRVGDLNTEGWQGGGVGDPTIILRWNWYRPFEGGDIRNVATHLYFGFSLPLSKQKDEDKLFSLPLGSDGHWGIPFGGSFELLFAAPIKIGMAADLLWQVAESRPRRVKTDINQTSLLLLHKALTQRKPGLTWRAHWFAEGVHLWRGLSVLGGYEFVMHHNDELHTAAEGFRSEIINTAETTQNWYVHTITSALKYDLSAEFAGAPVAPFIEGFLKFPVSGRRVVNASTVGMQVVIRF